MGNAFALEHCLGALAASSVWEEGKSRWERPGSRALAAGPSKPQERAEFGRLASHGQNGQQRAGIVGLFLDSVCN